MMAKRWVVLAAGLALIGAAPLRADEIYDGCTAKSDISNIAADDCAKAWLKREDDLLNVAWKGAFAALSGEAKDKLLTEQRAWLAYKDASCLFYADRTNFGREGAVFSFPRCRAEVLEGRTKTLKGIAEGAKPR